MDFSLFTRCQGCSEASDASDASDASGTPGAPEAPEVAEGAEATGVTEVTDPSDVQTEPCVLPFKFLGAPEEPSKARKPGSKKATTQMGPCDREAPEESFTRSIF